MDNLDGLKQWKCGKGHVLGVVRREAVSANGSTWHATRLLLFREAIDLTPGPFPIREGEQAREEPRLADVDVMAVVEGTTLDVCCSVCGERRTWWMGEAATELLMERMGLALKEGE